MHNKQKKHKSSALLSVIVGILLIVVLVNVASAAWGGYNKWYKLNNGTNYAYTYSTQSANTLQDHSGKWNCTIQSAATQYMNVIGWTWHTCAVMNNGQPVYPHVYHLGASPGGGGTLKNDYFDNVTFDG